MLRVKLMEEEYGECEFDGNQYPLSELEEVDTGYETVLVHVDNVDEFISMKRNGKDYYDGH